MTRFQIRRPTVERLLLLWAVIAVSSLAGCESTTIINKDIIGTWVNESGAEIRFEANGRFSYRNLPTAILDEQKNVLISGNGDYWNLQSEDYGQQYISLHFFWIDAIKERTEHRLDVDGDRLYFAFAWNIEGAIGDRFYFEKKPEK